MLNLSGPERPARPARSRQRRKAATRRVRRRTRRRRPYLGAARFVAGVTLGAGLVAVVLLLRWYGPAFLPASEPAAAEVGGSGPLAPVTLFYLSRDGTGLVGRERRIDPAIDPVERARAIVRRQLDPAPPPLLSPFPEGTRLRSLYLAADGNAFVDLSREVSAEHPGGSLDELFTVYALVNALTLNVAEIGAVQIMVGGREVDTLAGHIDLRRPLEANLAWVVDSPGNRGDARASNPGSAGRVGNLADAGLQRRRPSPQP
ncbi:MAG: GerMN domain-containing protein [Acidobacteria bacterium]|nr:GerMN domain-containing protein [Acidobacteriota bacterium]